mgnify:CR=1 FL=1
MSKLRAKTLKSQLTKQYNLRPGKRFNYKDEGTDRLYEVQKLYPNCILLKDVFDGIVKNGETLWNNLIK